MTNDQPPLRVAVIGGGLSGLATAAHLKLAAAERVHVVVYEASDRVGGVIHTETVDVAEAGRFILDHGADMFTTQPPAALDLCQRLGVADRLLSPKKTGRGAMIAEGNDLIAIPEGFVLMRATRIASMLKTRLLSWRGKARLAAEALVGPRRDDVEDESVGSFVRRRMGNEVLERIVAPLVAGIYTADVERLSMAATMKPIWDMEATYGSLAAATWRRRRSGNDATENSSSGARYEQFRAFPGGMIEFIDVLTHAIGHDSIELNRSVLSINNDNGKFAVQPTGERFDHIVLAVPTRVSARLLRTLVSGSEMDTADRCRIESAIDAIASIPNASTAIVLMAVRRTAISRMPSTFGFVVPPRENRAILAGSFASEKFHGRAPDGFVIIRAFVGGRLNPGILTRSDEDITAIVRNELGDLIGLDTDSPLDQIAPVHRVVRWTDAMPQYEVGHLRIAAQIESAMQSFPKIHLAGNSLNGVGIAPVIASAKKICSEILHSNP